MSRFALQALCSAGNRCVRLSRSLLQKSWYGSLVYVICRINKATSVSFVMVTVGSSFGARLDHTTEPFLPFFLAETVSVANRSYRYPTSKALEHHQRTQFHSNRNRLMRYLTKTARLPADRPRPIFPLAFKSVTPKEHYASLTPVYTCPWCDGFKYGASGNETPAHLIRHISKHHVDFIPDRFHYGLFKADDPENVVKAAVGLSDCRKH